MMAIGRLSTIRSTSSQAGADFLRNMAQRKKLRNDGPLRQNYTFIYGALHEVFCIQWSG